jgi:hypothetical protein
MQPIAPQPNTVNPQGVASVTPIAAPTPTIMPAAPQVVATPAPVATPNFDTSGTLGKIADYYSIPRQTAAITGAGQAQGQVSQQQFEAQKFQNQVKIQNQQNSLDPTKYQFTKNPDGSVDILNSVGDKVDIGTYAALTGADPATALQKAGATDQASQKFMAAYNNLQNYIQTKIGADNGDVQAKAQLADYYGANPGLQNMELGQLQQSFMQQYGQYFGQPQGDQSALANKQIGSTIASENNPATVSPYQNTALLNAAASNPYQPAGVFTNGTAGGTTYGQTGTGNNISSMLSSLQQQLPTGQ